MKTQHTPGPWKLQFIGSELYVETSDPIMICDMQFSNNPLHSSIVEANAQLISVAPDMLEALKYAESLIKTARKYFPKSIQNADRFELENVNATIGKAIHKATS